MIKILICFFITVNTAFCRLVISEVCPNPTGSSSSIPGDLSHEFIEFYNTGPDTLDLCGYYIKTGSSASSAAPDSNNIQVWQGDSLRDIGKDSLLKYDSLLFPGNYAVLFGRKYASAPESSWYKIRSGTAIFATRKTYIRSGTMANSSTWIEVYDSLNRLVCTFNRMRSSAMDPGEGLTWHLCHPDSSDSPANWKIAFPSPGGPFSLGLSRIYAHTLVINEFMNDPFAGEPEWIELYNYGPDTVSLAGWTLGGNENSGMLLCVYPVFVPAGEYVVVAESGSAGKGTFQDLLCALIVPQDWDALKRDDDIIYIRDPQNATVDSVHYCEGWFPVKKGVSVERVNADLPSNTQSTWRKSSNNSGATPGFANSPPAKSSSSFRLKVANRVFAPGSGDLNMRIDAPLQGEVTLKIFDMKGRLIKTIYEHKTETMPKQAVWDGVNNNGKLALPGPYLVYCECLLNGKQDTRIIPIALAVK